MSDEPDLPEVPDVRTRSAFGPAADRVLPIDREAQLIREMTGRRVTYRTRIDTRTAAGIPIVTSLQ